MTSDYKALTFARERELLGLALSGDDRAREELIRAFIPLADRFVAPYRNKSFYDDLRSQAFLGLLKAADRFDLAQPVRFSTYAQHWIRSEVSDYIRRNCSALTMKPTANTARLAAHYVRLRGEANVRGIFGRQVEHQFIAGRLGIGLELVESYYLARFCVVGLDDPIGRNDGDSAALTLADTIPDPTPQADDTVSHTLVRESRLARLHAALERLDPRSRYIFTQRTLIDPIRTLEDLGNEFHVSRERIRQIEAAAMKKIRRYLEADRRHYTAKGTLSAAILANPGATATQIAKSVGTSVNSVRVVQSRLRSSGALQSSIDTPAAG